MPFKKDDKGMVVMSENGMPIFVGPDGTEKPYDVDAKSKQIAELTEKASRRSKELDELKAKYSLLAEIEDLAAYVEEHRKNADIVAGLKDKDRDNEIKIQERIKEAIKAAVTPVATERDKLKVDLETATAGLNRAVIGSAFSNSKFAAEKLVSPALARQLFEGNFYVKDGKAIGRDANGQDIYGIDGGIATFDEALSRFVEESPFKENLLKATRGGSGFNDGGGNNSHLANGKKFTDMTLDERVEYLKKDENLKRR